MPVRSPPAAPEAEQLPAVSRQTVSVLPPAIDGNCMVALPVPVGLRPCRMTWREEVLLARLMEPVVVPGVPTVRVEPATVRVPVKLALLEMVWPFIRPEVMVPMLTRLPLLSMRVVPAV